jgi:hypothetical protein
MSTEPAAAGDAVATARIAFPSVAWFERLASLMNEQRALHEKLGYVDCTVRFTVENAPGSAEPWGAQVRFEEFAAVEVQAAQKDTAPPDFALEASFETWRGMIESIATGGGKPGLEQTLNDLNLRGGALRVTATDTLNRDMFFRYNQSLQAFVNASGCFETNFDEPVGSSS